MSKTAPKINWFNFFLLLGVVILIFFIATGLISGLLMLAWNGFAVAAFGLQPITWATAFWGLVLFELIVGAIKLVLRP